MRHLELDAQQIPVKPGQRAPSRRFELVGEQFDDGFDAVGEPARFTVAGKDRLIALEFLEGYPCAQVFAPATSSFICFEPMTAPANALRSGESLSLLSPGERYRARFSVSVQRIAGDL
jgi:aldose 1-epimerase